MRHGGLSRVASVQVRLTGHSVPTNTRPKGGKVVFFYFYFYWGIPNTGRRAASLHKIGVYLYLDSHLQLVSQLNISTHSSFFVTLLSNARHFMNKRDLRNSFKREYISDFQARCTPFLMERVASFMPFPFIHQSSVTYPLSSNETRNSYQ